MEPKRHKTSLNFSEDDFYEWLTKQDTADVVGLLQVFLKRFGDKNEDEKLLLKELKSHLKR